MGNNSQEWIRTSRDKPCPICGKSDWCSFSADGEVANCMRIAEGSFKTTRDEGYIHRLKDSQAPRVKRFTRSISLAPCTDMRDLAKKNCEAGRKKCELIQNLADQLMVPLWTLDRLQCGWHEDKRAFSFPMMNATGGITGIRLRALSGEKFAVTGSRDGLFIPTATKYKERLLICEGPTDCAAILSLGFSVIGRPSCTGGKRQIIQIVRKHRPEQVVVVADSDEAGQKGADRLAFLLCLHVSDVRMITPPEEIKDARAWVNAGAVQHHVEAVIQNTKTTTINVEGSVR